MLASVREREPEQEGEARRSPGLVLGGSSDRF